MRAVRASGKQQKKDDNMTEMLDNADYGPPPYQWEYAFTVDGEYFVTSFDAEKQEARIHVEFDRFLTLSTSPLGEEEAALLSGHISGENVGNLPLRITVVFREGWVCRGSIDAVGKPPRKGAEKLLDAWEHYLSLVYEEEQCWPDSVIAIGDL